MLATPEKATEPEFMTFVGRLRQAKRLDRIVIDEAHVILNDRLDFRKHLQAMGRLGAAETQMVLLTATLPPSMESSLWDRMYWQPNEVRLIRASTVRKNIGYSVVDGGKTKQERYARLECIVEEVLTDTDNPEGKVVVMCESRANTEEIMESGMFPCEAFHGKMSAERRAEILEEFRDGRIRVIAATGAFGMGIDIPDIRLIVSVDDPRSMMDYGQSSGRAGRDGAPSRAVIIRGGLMFRDARVEQYLEQGRKKCRRIDIDRYLDNDETREACREEEMFCDVCEKRRMEESSHVEEIPTDQAHEASNPRVKESQVGDMEREQAAVLGWQEKQAIPPEDTAEARGMIRLQDQQRTVPYARHIRQVQDSQLAEDDLQQRLEKWKGICVVCQQAGRPAYHAISRCSDPVARMADQERLMAQRRIKYGQGLVCYKCGVPRGMCRRIGGDGRVEAGQQCQYYGVLMGTVFGAKHVYQDLWQKYEEWMRRVRTRSGEGSSEGSSEVDLVVSLGQERRYGSWDRTTNLVLAFIWLTGRIEGR